jgi:ankyrin repeat protein
MPQNESNEWVEREQLHLAAQDGDLEKIRKLVMAGYPVNAFDDLSFTPLHYAVMREHFEVAKYLLSVGADVNAHEEEKIGNTPLGEIAGNCSFAMASLLVEAGADPSIPGWMQLTALHKAKARKKAEGRRVYELLESTAKKRHQAS